jgi:hypothetical protein
MNEQDQNGIVMNSPALDQASTATAPDQSGHARFHGRRSFRGAVMALTASAVLLVGLAGASGANAASPGGINSAACNPNNQTIQQRMEAYRSFPSEYVLLQGALVNKVTGAIRYSGWFVGTGATASSTITYSGVARGQYNVFVASASWDSVQRRYVYSAWNLVPSPITYGKEWSSGIYFGGANGSCYI